MYIAHYKSVSSSLEFFSKERDSLDFPTQVEYKSERYLLFRTLICDTPSKKRNIINTAKQYGIKHDVELSGQ
jgi:hypothetical protein